MHFVLLPIAASLLSLVLAQTGQPGPNPFIIPPGLALVAGKPTKLEWDPTTSGTVSLYLRSGAASDLNEGTLIEGKIDNAGSYTFTPPASTVRNSDYTIEIRSDSDPSKVNFTPQIVIESSNTVQSVTPPASTAARTTAAVSSEPTPSSTAQVSSSEPAPSSTAPVSSSIPIPSSASSEAVVSSASSESTASAASSASVATSASATSAGSRSSSTAARASATGSRTQTGIITAPSGGAAVRNGVSAGAAAMVLGMMAWL